MEHYLAERYLSPRGGVFLAEDGARLDEVGQGRARLVQTLYVPDDEICFYVFESDSARLVQQVAADAGIAVTRVLRVAVA